MDSSITIELAPGLTAQDRAALKQYLADPFGLSDAEWQRVRSAIDLLAQSTIVFSERHYAFQQFYAIFINGTYARPYLRQLAESDALERDGPQLQAATAMDCGRIRGVEGTRLEMADEKESEMTQKTLDALEPEQFDALIETFIDRSEPDTLSFEAFDQATRRLAQKAVAETIELTGVVEKGAIVFDPSRAAPVIARSNEIVIGGLRLVVKLRPDLAVAPAH